MQGFVKDGQILKLCQTKHNENRRNSYETKMPPFSDDFNNVCRIGPKIQNGSQTQRIHSLKNLQKRTQFILTPHKKKRIFVLPCQLPTIGCNEKKARISLKFPPQRIKKIF
ncbi:unnamed protein product [Paramecium primaurelia]|uniref:Uncharacterized protein n=1 Tax=Paramecium primaurelia TaxID=5886 RepID=A0A8S1LA79_PARPR|nr:unnamed protein product [Paramecium primaurelia]